jgi:hypothetical protein
MLVIIEYRPWDPKFEALIEAIEGFSEAYEKMLLKTGSYKSVYSFIEGYEPEDYFTKCLPYNWTDICMLGANDE